MRNCELSSVPKSDESESSLENVGRSEMNRFCFTSSQSFKAMDFFRTGGGEALLHSIAFGGVFPNITEAILVDEISTKVKIYPPKVIT